MKFREIWRFGSQIYRELAFQSIYSLRAGAGLPQRGKTRIEQQVRQAQTSTLISKIITAVFIVFFGFGIFLPSAFFRTPSSPPVSIALVGGISSFLGVVLFLIIVMGLQVATSFVSTKAVEILSPLPLTRRDISMIMFLCFLRVFDLPLAAATVSFIVAYLIAGGTVLGAVLAFGAMIVTEIFALAITVALSRFFYSRVSSGGGRSRLKAVLRIIFMFIWLLPSFGLYLIASFGVNLINSFSSLTEIFGSYSTALALAYPFNFGFLVTFATVPFQASPATLALVGVSSIIYLSLAVYGFRWLVNAIRKIGAGGIVGSAREIVKDTVIKPASAWMGIIRKDLRVASRAPSLASLFLLPVFESLVLAATFASFTNADIATTLGVLTGISAITVLLPPTLFSIEGLASSYTRSMPLTKRALIVAKTTLIMVTYLISMGVLFFVALFFGRDFSYVLVFGLLQTFSVASASMIELKILANKFWKEGGALGNLYARLTVYITIMLPGLVMVSLPMIGAIFTFFARPQLAPFVFAAIAISEFALTALYAFARRK